MNVPCTVVLSNGGKTNASSVPSPILSPSAVKVNSVSPAVNTSKDGLSNSNCKLYVEPVAPSSSK